VAEAPAVRHAGHDLELVASLLDRASSDPRSEQAARLVASCPECGSVHQDLALIAAATHLLPAVRRRRDFRLTIEDAGRLRPTLWRRLVDAFASSGDSVSRPLALGLSTLGLVGLMIATVSTPFAGSAVGSAAPEIGPVNEPLTPLDAAGPAASVDQADGGGARATIGGPDGPTSVPATDGMIAISPLVIVSASLVASGLGIGIARIVVRRARWNHSPFEVV